LVSTPKTVREGASSSIDHHSNEHRHGPDQESSCPARELHPYPFGHGLTWTSFAYEDLALDADTIPTDGTVRISATVRNTGRRDGTEVVQLYLSDPVASVVRPVRWLAGWARVRLAPGCAARVEFTVHSDRVSFTGQDLRRRVEPGLIHAEIGRSSADLRLSGSFGLEGPDRIVGLDRVLTVPVRVTPR